MSIIPWPGAGKRRERRARSWDVIAENCDRLLQIYAAMSTPCNDGFEDRVRARRKELVAARENAALKASRIRSGLE